VAWYGRLTGVVDDLHPLHPLDLVKSIKAPVLGLYGAEDQGIPVEMVEMMQDELKAVKHPSEIIIYPNAPHAFHADYRASYRLEPAQDGWKRLQAWFKKYGVA
jgi:carboxymethylenebutenolidase